MRFINAVQDVEGAHPHFFGFVDKIVVGVERPKSYMHQLFVYNDYKLNHALTYQEITISNELILHAYGPMKG